MSMHTNAVLTPYIARARKVLQLEQRANHQDSIVKPGGLELFVVRWAEETSTVCRNAGLDLKPIHRFTEHLEGYRSQDPMQRAASLRAALAILDEIDSNGEGGRPQARKGTSFDEDGWRPQGSPPTITQPPPLQAEKQLPKSLIKTDKTINKTDGKTSPAPTQSHNSIRLEAGMSAGHTALTLLSADITAIPGVGPSVAARLHNLGIRNVRDLLFYFPREHRDYSKLEKIANLPFNEV